MENIRRDQDALNAWFAGWRTSADDIPLQTLGADLFARISTSVFPDDFTKQLLDGDTITLADKLVIAACGAPGPNDLKKIILGKFRGKENDRMEYAEEMHLRLVKNGVRHGLMRLRYHRVKWFLMGTEEDDEITAEEAQRAIYRFGVYNTAIVKDLGAKAIEGDRYFNWRGGGLLNGRMLSSRVKAGYFTNVVLPYLYPNQKKELADDIIRYSCRLVTDPPSQLNFIRAHEELGDLIIDVYPEPVPYEQHWVSPISIIGYLLGPKYYHNRLRSHALGCKPSVMVEMPATYAFGYEVAAQSCDNFLQAVDASDTASRMFAVSFFLEQPELAAERLRKLDILHIKRVYRRLRGPDKIREFYEFLWRYEDIRRKIGGRYSRDKNSFMDFMCIA